MSRTLEEITLLIKRVQHRHHRLLDEALSSLGISLVQWNALREIERNPGSSQHRLAMLTFNSDQAFGTLCTRLLQRGLVERSAGTGRALHLHLSPEGNALLMQGVALHANIVADSLSALSEDEQQVLGALLARLLPSDGEE